MSDLVEKVFNGILEYVRVNHLQPGDRLPSERAFAEMFSVGRPVVREAARALDVLDVIQIRKQGGMFVSTLDNSSQLDNFRLHVQLGQVSLQEVLEVRLILETECASRAATHITDKQLDTLDKILSGVSVDDAKGFAEADVALHQTIYSSTGNRALQLLTRTVSMWSIVSRSFSNSFIEVRQVVHIDHQNIVRALRSRNPEASREAMRLHLVHLNQINAVRDMMKVELSALLDSTQEEKSVCMTAGSLEERN